MVCEIQSTETVREDALCEYALGELEAAGPIEPGQESLYRDVARSVAVYCADDLARGMPAAFVPVLLSRALWGVGECDAAERMMNRRITQRTVRRTLKALLPIRDVSPMLWKAALYGSVRCHDDWSSENAGPLGVLDLTRIRMTPCDIELARFLSVRALVRALAPIWEASSGEGALAIRWNDAAAFTMRPGRQRKQTGERRDVIALCRDVLARESERRGWQSVPRLMCCPG